MTPHPSTQGRFLAVRKPTAHNLPVSLRLLQSALLGAALFVLVIHSASADQTASQYTIPADVIDAGGADVSKSNLYLLSDSIGEPVVGFGASDDYILNSGYRQPSASDFISVACSAEVNLGSVPGTGQRTGTGTCMVYTDAYSGYRLIWQAGANNRGGLIGHWKFDETSGANAYDSSGYGNTGTHEGSPTIVNAVPSRYFSTRSLGFSSPSSQYVDVADFLGAPEKLSGCLWAKQSSVADNKGLFGQWNHSSDTSWTLQQESSISLNYADTGGVTGYTTGGASLSTDWKHVCFVFDGTQSTNATRLKIYVNGVSQSLTYNGSSVPSRLRNSSAPITIGRLQGVGRYFDGNIDDVRLYETALTENEVRDLASLAPPGSLTASGSQTTHIPGIYMPFTGGLVGYWRLDESIAGSTAADASGYNNDGTPAGAGGSNNKPQPSTSVPGGTNFLTTRSLHFDGTDDVLDAGNASVLTMTNPFTVSAWVRSTGDSNYGYIAGKGDTSDLNGYYITIDQSTGYPTVYSMQAAAYQAAVVATNIKNDGIWHHLLGTFNGTHLRMYLDGVAGTAVAASNPTSNSSPFRIGASNYAGRFFTGNIDDVRVYNRALSLAEITALASAPQAWSVAADESAWGARISSLSTDTDAKWGTDGTSEKWLNIGDGSYPLVRRYTATPLEGSEELVEFRAEVGSSKIQESGLYTGVATFTVVGY
jgi:hypothetical protein